MPGVFFTLEAEGVALCGHGRVSSSHGWRACSLIPVGTGGNNTGTDMGCRCNFLRSIPSGSFAEYMVVSF